VIAVFNHPAHPSLCARGSRNFASRKVGCFENRVRTKNSKGVLVQQQSFQKRFHCF